jgi:CubicO group peptidase (beta-lactamase class C family)
MPIRILIVLVTLFPFTHAQTPSSQVSPPLAAASPKSVGMSEERLQRIDRMAEEAIANDEIPGLVALVARNGKIVYHKAFGVADVESGRPMRTDDIFRIASQTKAITATATMMLWEEGLFRLDDPISKYIHEFRDPQILDTYDESNGTYTTVPAKGEITIRHLLTHASGLGYGMIDRDPRFKAIYKKAGIIDAWTTEPHLLADNIKRLAGLPLVFEPGERYRYSLGLDVLGYFVEILTGKSFDTFLAEHLFNPLRMNDTSFYLPDAKADRLVTAQSGKTGSWTKYEGLKGYYDADFPILGAKTYFSGGGGLLSTAKDYATFLQMYLNGGELYGTRFLSRTTIDTIMAKQQNMGNDTRHYGLAFSVLNENGVIEGGLGSEGTFNWGGYFNTQYFADPNEGIIGVILKQNRHGFKSDTTSWKFRQLVFQAIDD